MAVHGPDELIATVPYLLGFHPRESFVVVWIASGTIGLTQRFDLAEAPRSPRAAQAVLRPGLRIGATHMVIVAYAEHPLPPEIIEWISCVPTASVEILDVVRTHDWRWWSLLCDQECCPPQGRMIDPKLRERVAADFVLEGKVAYLDRADLWREIAPDPDLIAGVHRALSNVPSDQPDALLAGCLQQWRRVDRQQHRSIRARAAATQIAALRHIPTRDRIGWHLAHLESAQLLATCWFMRAVMRAAPPGDVAPIGTMAAIAHWLAGDGARASACLDRALDDDPTYVLGQLIAKSLQAGLPPGEWRALIRALPGSALIA